MLTMSIDTDGRVVATQRDVSPTVYLDHWALRELSTTPMLAERFVAALKQRSGTLALSCTNLIEFCNVTDDQQAGRAEELLEASLPHVFFIEMDPFWCKSARTSCCEAVRPDLPTKITNYSRRCFD